MMIQGCYWNPTDRSNSVERINNLPPDEVTPRTCERQCHMQHNMPHFSIRVSDILLLNLYWTRVSKLTLILCFCVNLGLLSSPVMLHLPNRLCATLFKQWRVKWIGVNFLNIHSLSKVFHQHHLFRLLQGQEFLKNFLIYFTSATFSAWGKCGTNMFLLTGQHRYFLWGKFH